MHAEDNCQLLTTLGDGKPYLKLLSTLLPTCGDVTLQVGHVAGFTTLHPLPWLGRDCTLGELCFFAALCRVLSLKGPCEQGGGDGKPQLRAFLP